MAKKQQVILLHGNGAFNNPSLLTKGEVAIEHGNGAENVKIHTIDDNNQLATFITETAIDNKITPISYDVSTLQGTVGDANSGLVKDVAANTATLGLHDSAIDALETTVGDENSGLVKDVAALKAAVGNSEGEDTLASRVSALEGDVSTLEGTVGDENSGLVKDVNTLKGNEETEGSVAKSIKDAIDALDAEMGSTTVAEGKHVAVYVKEENGVITNVTVTEKDIASADTLSTVSGKVDTLIGGDTGVSVRSIAAAEVAKIVAEAPEDFNTLQEIAEWITNDTIGATQMANDIAALKSTTAGFSKDATIKATTDKLSGKIDTLNGNNTTEGSVAKSIKDAIDALDTEMGSTTVAENKHVAVYVKEENGVITNVTVTEKDIASAETLGTVSGKVSTLEGTVGDSTKGLVKDVNTLKGDEKTEGSVAKSIKDAIDALDSTKGSTTVDTGKHVAVQVVEENGVITSVTVTEDNIASADTLSTVSGKVDTIEENYVATIKIQNTAENKINAQKTGNEYSFNFDAMVIDCGTY